MKRAVILFCLAAASFISPAARAMFAWYQTQQVPIDRLFTNLQQRLERDKNNFELTYELARLHSMAYSTNLVSFTGRTNDGRPEFYSPGVDTGAPRGVYLPKSPESQVIALHHLTNAIRLYERAMVLLKKSTNDAPYKEWLVLPLELGYAWCLDQSGARNDALAAYRKVLALAWKKEVIGEFSFKEWADDTWEALKSGSNPFRVGKRRRYRGPGPCFSEETIGYMLKLLNPVKDAKEIAELKDKQKTLSTMGRMVTPIILPLIDGADLTQLVDADAHVSFDLDGSGLPRQWGWTTPKAAWLVFDPKGEGRITSALQMFGNCTFWIFWRNGYEALRSLDDNHDGVLQGPELRGLALWHDQNGNGISEPGEVRPVADYGITAICCASEVDSTGISWSPNGIIFGNRKTRPTYDWIAPSEPGQR